MISVIICSINETFRNNISQNVKETIGCDYEFLFYDNNINQKGLCKVYNELAEKSKSDYLCFIHEDILFETNNWGEKLIKSVKDETTGVIGVAGSGTMLPFPYWLDRFSNVNRIKQYNREGRLIYDKTVPQQTKLLEVIVLDGVLLFCRRDIWKQYKFDDKVFTGFHIYDVDFTFQVAQTHNNYVSQELIISHFSTGNINRSFYDGMLLFNKKWSNQLPKTIDSEIFEKYSLNKLGHYYRRNFIKEALLETKISYKYILYFLWANGSLKSIWGWFDTIKYIIKFRMFHSANKISKRSV